jgi:hypothetical protein
MKNYLYAAARDLDPAEMERGPHGVCLVTV